MTVSEHTYTATVAGLPLTVKGGDVSLDAGRSPHVQATLTVAAPGEWTPGAETVLVPGYDIEHPEVGHFEEGDIVAPTVVGAPTYGAISTGTAVTVNRPAGAAVGDIVLVGFRSSTAHANDLIMPTGFGRIGLPQTSGDRIHGLYVKPITDLGAEPASYTFTTYASGRNVAVARLIRGVDLTDITEAVLGYSNTNPIPNQASDGIGAMLAVALFTDERTSPRSYVPDATTGGYTTVGNAQNTLDASTSGSRTALWLGALTVADGVTSVTGAGITWNGGTTASRSAFALFRGLPGPDVWVVDSPAYTETVPPVVGMGPPTWTPSPAVLAALDPRTSPRVILTAHAEFPSSTQDRTFNLGVREYNWSERDAEVTLELASDEALLEDHAPLMDDITPRLLQSSLKSIVNYVLNAAIPGAAITPVIWDFDWTAYWAATNVIPNPSVVGSLGTYYAPRDGASAADYSTAVGGALGTTSCARWTASGTGIAQLSARQHTATEHTAYTMSAYVRSPNSRQMRIRLFWRDSEGELIRQDVSAATVAPNNWNTRIHLTAVAPQGTAKVGVVIERVSGTAGEFLYADMLCLHEGDWLQPYWDGSTTPSGYTTAWTDTAHQSPSTRTPNLERDPEALTWRAGQSAIDFLQPILQAAGLRLVCDEARVWTLRGETYTAAGGLDIRYGLNMKDGAARIARNSGLWFVRRVTRYKWRRNGRDFQRDDYYALPGVPGPTTLLELDTPFPGPGRSEYAVRRAQTRGREVTAVAVADWRARAEMPLTVVLSTGPFQTGKTQTVTWRLDDDSMTVTGPTTDLLELPAPPG